MAALLIGYARCSTDQQDLTAQRDGLIGLGVPTNRIYVDHGLTGANRERPGLREALAACRDGDTLVVTKLDRLARSLPDARAIADELTARHVRLSLGGSVYDPTMRWAGCCSTSWQWSRSSLLSRHAVVLRSPPWGLLPDGVSTG
jgi:DNA invertase Pin-like site-specific DNA recombinase